MSFRSLAGARQSSQSWPCSGMLSMLSIPEHGHDCEDCLAPASDLNDIETQLQEIETRVFALRDEDLRLSRQRERLEVLHHSMETLAPIAVSISDLRKLEHLHL